MKNILFVVLCVLVSVGFSVSVNAKSNYQAKKQGQVHFDGKNDVEVDEVSLEEENVNPQDIEPAAGAEDAAETEEGDVADNIKLPRKN